MWERVRERSLKECMCEREKESVSVYERERACVFSRQFDAIFQVDRARNTKRKLEERRMKKIEILSDFSNIRKL